MPIIDTIYRPIQCMAFMWGVTEAQMEQKAVL
jgi:hypothetical protein